MSTPDSISPFKLSIPQADLDDLQLRLRLARWPDKEPVSDWSQGVTLAAIQDLCEYWQTSYSWRRCEDLLNSYPQFTTTIDGVEIYFLHFRSKHENALPMLLTHGWPGSVLEFRHVTAKFVEPEAHGGAPEDAFHLVIPALPGYAFSGKPTETGWNYERTARAWAVLMQRLGYAESGWVAQGGDWGAHVTANLGNQAPKGLRAVHMNSVYFEPEVRCHPHFAKKSVCLQERLAERNPHPSPRQVRRRTRNVPPPPPRNNRLPRLLSSNVHAPPNPRLRTRRLPSRPGKLDIREIPRLVPSLRRRRDRLQQRRNARQHHAVLALQLWRFVGSLLLGE